MTRRQIAARAFDSHHKYLLLRLRTAPRGQIAARRKELVAYVSALLASEQ